MGEADDPVQHVVDEYFTAMSEQSKQHDDRLLWAAGGLAALSVSFTLGLLPEATVIDGYGLLAWSWALLGAAVVLVLLGIQVSNYGFWGRVCTAQRKKALPLCSGNALAWLIMVVNLLAVTALAAAFVFLALFAFRNLEGFEPRPETEAQAVQGGMQAVEAQVRGRA